MAGFIERERERERINLYLSKVDAVIVSQWVVFSVQKTMILGCPPGPVDQLDLFIRVHAS